MRNTSRCWGKESDNKKLKFTVHYNVMYYYIYFSIIPLCVIVIANTIV
jgi:hypothetical protein